MVVLVAAAAALAAAGGNEAGREENLEMRDAGPLRELPLDGAAVAVATTDAGGVRREFLTKCRCYSERQNLLID